MTYAEKLKDPRWQRKRLEILEARGWRCEGCDRKDKTLHVHHGLYLPKVEPWDYDNDLLWSLCEDCHRKAEEYRLLVYLAVAHTHPLEVLAFLGARRGAASVDSNEEPVGWPVVRGELVRLADAIEHACQAGDSESALALYDQKQAIALEWHAHRAIPPPTFTGASERLEGAA